MKRSWLVGLLMLGACSSLKSIAADECGNGVIEAGEDCDLFSDPELGAGIACAPPGDIDECRYVCSDATPCPAGWGCGSDEICRFASGTFAEITESPFQMSSRINERDPPQVSVADVDGDGVQDIVAFGQAKVAIRFGDGEGGFFGATDFALNSPNGPPAVGDVSGDGTADFVLPLPEGVFTVLGETDRTLSPVAYSSFDLGQSPDKVRIMTANLSLPLPDPVMVTLAVLIFEVGSDLEVLLPDVMLSLVLPGRSVGDFAGRPFAGELDIALFGVDEVCFPFRGDTSISIYGFNNDVLELRQTVPLPGPIFSGARFVDFDGDGDLDLMVSVFPLGDEERVAVAINSGGTFGAATIRPIFDQLLPTTGEDPQFATRWPLAAGNIAGDAGADYVTPYGIHVRYLLGTVLSRRVTRSSPKPWINAEIVDFNADGVGDVAASAETLDGIDVYLGTPAGLFNYSRLPTTLGPVALRSGDFDGDFVGDLAIVEREVGVGDTLSILFGNLQGPPNPPAFMVELDRIDSIEPGAFELEPNVLPDAIDDLIVLANSPSNMINNYSVALMLGTTERRMFSPFGVGDESPQTVIIGDFSPNADGIKDLFVVAKNPWEIEGAGGAAFEPQSAFLLPDTAFTNANFLASCALWVAGDLDGDNSNDEIVGMDNTSNCNDTGAASQLLVGSVIDAGGSRDVDVSAQLVTTAHRFPRELSLADLDGDGKPELIVAYAGSGASDSGVVVYWNSNGQISLLPASVVPDVGDKSVSAHAINANADAQRELVIATGTNLVLTRFEGSAFQPPTEIVRDVPAGRVVVADIDSDGVDDIIVANFVSVRVYRGLPGGAEFGGPATGGQ